MESKGIIKIKKSLVEQIIKEETLKIKNLINLQEEKNNLQKQLDELYQQEQIQDIEENWFTDKMGIKNSGEEQLRQKPFLQKALKDAIAQNPQIDAGEIRASLIDFLRFGGGAGTGIVVVKPPIFHPETVKWSMGGTLGGTFQTMSDPQAGV